MEKELKIKVKFNELIIKVDVNEDNWNNANLEEQNFYLKERIKEHLDLYLDNILDELINLGKITY